ncbi:phenylacetate--CoA ligase family protein [Conexibacter woesei]|uniref:Phenylacetate--CoA ligase n=1 Tax=Conexibacter woesei (strain DSM 14684 / CCUG 47730 / CIP 108061 / JCM 11494 / NBRC 100937 / ID131577) TaxID=469383 RepID=D3F5B0_CONWI|nr:phenylacetate--CoA ligase family protein [Conexibacter woesei]ADB50577.1 Phenylacetate--CoA ligase [Conexibacter woesei DSM 14684]
MTQSPYWNPRIETLPREQLEALQLAKLRTLCEWAQARSPWYRRSFAQGGFEPGQLRSLDDLRRIPLLTREQWMTSQDERPPYGELPTIAPETAIRVHTTSGTSGRTPLRALDSRKDWAWIAEMWAYGLWACGVRPSDTAYVAFGYGSFIGFWGLHYAMEKIGVLNVPGGAQTTEARVKQILSFDATVVASTPTYALRLAQEADQLGLDLRGSAVKRVILSGEPAGSIPETKALIEQQWGAKAYDTAGMTEVGTIVMFECEHQPGGAHIIEDHVLEESLDPETLEPAASGERAERVVTSFGRHAIPLIRYRTGDEISRVPGSRCGCGRTADIYAGGILGRVDDMKLVRGTNVYPRAIEGIVRAFPHVEEFQVRITREGLRDEIALLVETAPDHADAWPEVSSALRRELADAHEGLNFRVERAEAGALPRFELKAKRMVDLRDRPMGA